MKKRVLFMTTITALASSLLFSSCIGSFNLSRKLLAWNQTIDSKFVNELVFVVLTPAYAVTWVADILVINAIEFWKGENPLQVGIVKEVQGENGIYTVETLENGYHIQNQDGEEINFVYDKDSNVWSIVSEEQSQKLIQIEDNGKAIVYLPNGGEQEVEISSNGVLALSQTVQDAIYFAAK